MTAPREHGTYRGARQHYKNGEDSCPPCAEAERQYQRERAQRQRRELAQRRAGWQREPPEPARKPDAREAAILAAHRDGGLVLG